jgi:hypothetical protein
MFKNIIKGYKGVMDLDLSLVPDLYKKTAIDQHYKDIAEYKRYQASLKKEHRYENTILRINKQVSYENMMKNERLKRERGY